MVVSNCPLCDSEAVLNHVLIDVGKLWRDLEERIDSEIPESVKHDHFQGPVELVDCANCGLQYFLGSSPGRPEFYEMLSSASQAQYYETDRWEFEVARRYIHQQDRVVDLGAGKGSFVASLDTVEAVGVDSNPDVRSSGQGPIVGETFLEHATRRPGYYSIVTAFQIMEHVPSVSELLGPATTMLRPGGRLLISVPNRDRTIAAKHGPLDFPPHHISRWGADQFQYLAERHGLRLRSIDFEPLVLGKPPFVVCGWFSRSLASAYVLALATMGVDISVRRTIRQLLSTAPPVGHTVLAQFELPGADSE